MRASEVALLGALAWKIPPLRQELAEHLVDNDGEILPHVLMSAYERWAERVLRSEEPLLSDFLAQLEDAYAVGGRRSRNSSRFRFSSIYRGRVSPAPSCVIALDPTWRRGFESSADQTDRIPHGAARTRSCSPRASALRQR